MRSGHAHDDLHVVLDQEHGDVLLVPHPADEVDERGGLLRVHPGGRLVEEEQLRLRRESARDLEPPLVAVGSVPDSSSCRLGEPAVDEQLLGACRRSRAPRAGRAACGRSSRRCRPSAGCACRRARSRGRSSGGRAGCSGTCARRRARRSRAAACRTSSAVEDDAPGGGDVDPGEHVEERRLARAVRSDQRDDRAARDREVDVVGRDEPAELLAHLLRDEQVVGRIAISRRSGRGR